MAKLNKATLLGSLSAQKLEQFFVQPLNNEQTLAASLQSKCKFSIFASERPDILSAATVKTDVKGFFFFFFWCNIYRDVILFTLTTAAVT